MPVIDCLSDRASLDKMFSVLPMEHKLTKIHLSQNGLSYLPNSLGRITTLEGIDLSYNNFSRGSRSNENIVQFEGCEFAKQSNTEPLRWFSMEDGKLTYKIKEAHSEQSCVFTWVKNTRYQ